MLDLELGLDADTGYIYIYLPFPVFSASPKPCKPFCPGCMILFLFYSPFYFTSVFDLTILNNICTFTFIALADNVKLSFKAIKVHQKLK